jgi:hypothetical protein
MSVPEELWNQIAYQHRISTLANRVRMPWPLTCALDDVIEYRAHLVLFRLHNEIAEFMFDEGMAWAAAMEERIALRHRGRLFA